MHNLIITYQTVIQKDIYMDLILASKSKTRQRILSSACLPFHSQPAHIDETEIIKSLTSEGAKPHDIADSLAEFKCQKISTQYMDSIVLSCDQILSLNSRIYQKPKTKEIFIENMRCFSGQRIQLHTANVIYHSAKPVWRYVGKVDLRFRNLKATEIENYVEENWEDAKHSAGGLIFEQNPWLFESITGDWFDIMGISLRQVLPQLKMYMDLPENTQIPPLAGVLGCPIKHSKSPKIHKYWLQKNEIAGDYHRINIPPSFFEQTLESLFSLGFRGFNVTLPHKEAAFNFVKAKTQRAQKIGAVNTIYKDKNDTITGDCTDGYGFIENINQKAPHWQPNSGPALVLGAGGAARAIIHALLQAGVPKIYLSNRTRQRAECLAKVFGLKIEVIEWGDKSAVLTDIKTLVNTTSLGMNNETRIDLEYEKLNQDTLVTDIVYTPLMTDFLTRAADQGCITVDGLGMLLNQAAPGFEKWFNVKPMVDDTLRQKILS